MDTPTTANRPAYAVMLKLVAIGLFTVMATLIKASTAEVPPGQAVFFRSLFAIPVITIWIWSRGELREGLIPKNPMGHLWRGLFGTTAMAMGFAGLSFLPLPEVTAIGFVTPIFTVVLAALLLGERIRVFRMSAVVIGLVGVMIMIWPRLSLGDLSNAAAIGVFLALGSALVRSVVQIHIRRMVQTEHTAAIVFWFSVTATTLSLFTIPFGWVAPSTGALAMLISAGLIGGVAQILVTSSMRFGSPAMLAPIDYTSMLYALILGWMVFGDLPTVPMMLGASLVIAGGVVILWRERSMGQGRRRAQAVTDPKA